MKCPHCSKHDSKVLKTERPIDESVSFPFGTLKRRRRECGACERKFFTYEIHESAFRNMLTLMEGAPSRGSLRTKNKKQKPQLRTTHL